MDSDNNVFTGGAAAVLVCALAERGAFAEARELLRERGLDGALGPAVWDISVRLARARLWLAEGDFERAYAEAALLEELPLRAQWPEPVAASVALDRRAGARPPRAPRGGRRRWPTPSSRWPSASARRCRSPSRCTPARSPSPITPHASRSASAGWRCSPARPSGLEAVRLRLELGSALASMGRRVEARDALRPALADADAAGAVLLAQRARRELVATGLRPRQAALEGAAALTPRQRQICELAAAGKGNRAIAQELFLSIKTVETHLAAGYRKLGVGTRAELAAELAA